MNSFLKLALALGVLASASAGTVWYRRRAAVPAVSRQPRPIDDAAVKELTALREQRSQLSKVNQPDDTHQIYKHYQRIVGLRENFHSQPELFDVQVHVVRHDPLNQNDLVITPMDCLVEMGALKPAPEGSEPIFHVVHFTDDNDSFMDIAPLLVLEIDGDAFAMWLRDDETFLTSGPSYTNYSTMGYLEALLDTMLA